VRDDFDPAEAQTDEMRNGVVRLTHTHRFGRSIGELASAIQRDDADAVLDLLRSGDDAVSFIETPDTAAPSTDQIRPLRDDVVSAARELTAAAVSGDVTAALAGLDRHRLLCAHRRGPYGVTRWTSEIEAWLAAELGEHASAQWYPGRPLLVTANDHEMDLFNGDTGVVVDNSHGGGPIAAFGRGGEPILVSPSRLSAVQTVHAMTVHRAQGSQFDAVSLLLPSAESPLLTRELVYTAVTRAEEHVRVIGSEAAVRRAVGRPIVRASGLRRRAATASAGAP
jgi:exodeoxyribonuclease V alpha subunit